MNTVVAIRGHFDARFPDLKGLPRGADRVPGRDLANLVAKWLRRGRLAVERPELKCPSGGVMTEERLYCPVCFKVGTAKQLMMHSAECHRVLRERRRFRCCHCGRPTTPQERRDATLVDGDNTSVTCKRCRHPPQPLDESLLKQLKATIRRSVTGR